MPLGARSWRGGCRQTGSAGIAATSATCGGLPPVANWRRRLPAAGACAGGHKHANESTEAHLKHGDRLALFCERDKPHLRGLARGLWQRGVVHGIAGCLDICKVAELRPSPTSRSRRRRSRHPARESLSALWRAVHGAPPRNAAALPVAASITTTRAARRLPATLVVSRPPSSVTSRPGPWLPAP